MEFDDRAHDLIYDPSRNYVEPDLAALKSEEEAAANEPIDHFDYSEYACYRDDVEFEVSFTIGSAGNSKYTFQPFEAAADFKPFLDSSSRHLGDGNDLIARSVSNNDILNCIV